MSKDSKRSSSERLKYGICLNDECSLCKSKQVQSVPMRKDLICSECGKELRECPPPKKKSKTPIAIIITTIIIAIGIGLFFVLYDKKEDSIEAIIVPNDIIITDTIKSETITNANITPAENPIVEDEPKTVDIISKPLKETPKTLGNGELTLSYGKYSGAIKNGYPHGQGKLIYTKTRIINRHDMKSREATPGDYIIGEFYNGFVVYGKLYNSNGDLLSSLNFGVSNENNYDSK